MKKIIAFVLALSVLLGSWPSYAGYAQLKPPSGWSQGMGAAVPGTTGTFNFGTASNASTFKGKTVLTDAALNVAGQFVTVPVSLRLAANAATVAAEWSFGNPVAFALLLLTPVVYDYFRDSGVVVQSGVIGQKDPTACTVGPCFEYVVTDGGITVLGYSSTKSAAGAAFAGAKSDKWFSYTFVSCGEVTCSFKQKPLPDEPERDVAYYYSKRSVPPVADPPFLPIGLPQFKAAIGDKPIPDALPSAMPGVPWPVQNPVINPDPSISPQPAPAPAQNPRPLWVPTGDPVKNPNPSNNPDGSPGPNPKPDTWTQPGVKVTPSPTPTDPWRVDANPEPITKADPSPNTAPTTVTPPKPESLEIETCGLPGKPKCQIDESGTKPDAGTTLDPAKTALDTAKDSAKNAIDGASSMTAPTWSFSFQLPTGCAPYVTGLRGVILNVCEYQSKIHDLMSMIWAASTFFCLVGMVGRTIRES